MGTVCAISYLLRSHVCSARTERQLTVRGIASTSPSLLRISQVQSGWKYVTVLLSSCVRLSPWFVPGINYENCLLVTDFLVKINALGPCLWPWAFWNLFIAVTSQVMNGLWTHTHFRGKNLGLLWWSLPCELVLWSVGQFSFWVSERAFLSQQCRIFACVICWSLVLKTEQ